MLLELKRHYALKNSPGILIEINHLKPTLTGPEGTVCMESTIVNTNEQVLIPVAMLAESVETTAKKEKLAC